MMGKRGRAILKAIHIFFVSIWLGSSLSLLFVLLLGRDSTDLVRLLEIGRLLHLVVVVPSSIGFLITAIVFSMTTNLGFFKIHGITIAYAVTLSLILVGNLIFLPHLNGMIDVARNDPSGALALADFGLHTNWAVSSLSAQFLLLSVGLFSPKGAPVGARAENSRQAV